MKTKLLGYCAVDSGQILLVDPCYLKAWEDGEAFPKPNKKGKVAMNHYATCCEITGMKNQGGEILVSGIAGTGVVASSGIGDGRYPVYANYINVGKSMGAKKDDWRMSSLTIKFL